MKNGANSSCIAKCFFLSFILLLASPMGARAQHSSRSAVRNAGITGLILIEAIHRKLEIVRLYIGKPAEEVPNIVIKNATAREVFYQAVNLYQKSDRLAQEVARSSISLEPSKLNMELSQEDVSKVLTAAMQRIDAVIKALGIQPPTALEENFPKKTATSSDLYIAIITASQHINQLLDDKYRPADVYQKLTEATHIALTLFERFPGTPRNFKKPEFVPGKTPSDVFNLLIGCYAQIREIAMLSNIDILEISSVSKNGLYVPSEVYDIATLLVSELSYIHDTIPGLNEAEHSYYPGRVYPSDVYQRGILLRRSLDDLLGLIKKNPDWYR